MSEIVVLIGLVLLITGFFISPPRGPVMMGTGLLFASLAGLELALREHLAGFRSHTVVLAGVGALLTLMAGWLLLDSVLSPVARILAAAVVFGIGCWYFSQLFARRSGGSRFRL